MLCYLHISLKTVPSLIANNGLHHHHLFFVSNQTNVHVVLESVDTVFIRVCLYVFLVVAREVCELAVEETRDSDNSDRWCIYCLLWNAHLSDPTRISGSKYPIQMHIQWTRISMMVTILPWLWNLISSQKSEYDKVDWIWDKMK